MHAAGHFAVYNKLYLLETLLQLQNNNMLFMSGVQVSYNSYTCTFFFRFSILLAGGHGTTTLCYDTHIEIRFTTNLVLSVYAHHCTGTRVHAPIEAILRKF